MNNLENRQQKINKKYRHFNYSSTSAGNQKEAFFTNNMVKHISTTQKNRQKLNIDQLNQSSSKIDGIQVNYRLKTFQLMKKNAQLELQIQQSQRDVGRLSKEVDVMKEQMIEIIEINQALCKKGNSLQTRFNDSDLANFEKQKKTAVKHKKTQSSHHESSTKTYVTNQLVQGLFPIQSRAQVQGHHSIFTQISQQASKLSGPSHLPMHQLHPQSIHRLAPQQRPHSINRSFDEVSTLREDSSLKQKQISIKQKQQLLIKGSKIEIQELQKDQATPEAVSIYYQDKVNQILQQYKSLLSTQQIKLEAKNKSIKSLKKTITNRDQQISTLLTQIEQYKQENLKQIQLTQKEAECFNTQITELQDENNRLKNQKKQLHVALQEMREEDLAQISRNKNQREKQVEKYEAKIKQMKQEMNFKKMEYEEELKYLQELNNAEKKQRMKLQNRYQQQIKHFEQMEELVQKKLIEVECQMTYYKNQKKKLQARIRELETKLSVYEGEECNDGEESLEDQVPSFGTVKNNSEEQKKYYSFGDLQDGKEKEKKEQENFENVKHTQNSAPELNDKQSPTIQLYPQQIRQSLEILKSHGSPTHSLGQKVQKYPLQKQEALPPSNIQPLPSIQQKRQNENIVKNTGSQNLSSSFESFPEVHMTNIKSLSNKQLNKTKQIKAEQINKNNFNKDQQKPSQEDQIDEQQPSTVEIALKQQKSAQQQNLLEQTLYKQDQQYTMERDCYEQSIKTLLRENQRLKKMMTTFYKSMYQNGKIKGQKNQQLDPQVEMQMKILMSTRF